MPSARHTVACLLSVISVYAFCPSYWCMPSARHTGASLLPVIPAHAGIQSIRQFLIRKSCLTGLRPTPERRRGALTGLTSRVFGMYQRVSNTARHTGACLLPVILVYAFCPSYRRKPSVRHTGACLLPVIPVYAFCPSYRRKLSVRHTGACRYPVD